MNGYEKSGKTTGGTAKAAISRIGEEYRAAQRKKRSVLGTTAGEMSNVIRTVAKNPVTADQMRRKAAQDYIKNHDPNSPAQVEAVRRLRKQYGL